MRKFVPGTLWKKTLERTDSAIKSGALLPIQTTSIFVHDWGMDFLVRMVSSLCLKQAQKKVLPGNPEGGADQPNPFLPYEEDLFVADLSNSHVCLLNKFNVVPHHLLVVTREFEEQEALLTIRDFEAALTCLAEFNGLVFYNGGKTAGASQPHKHLQMIPLPMADNGPMTPIDPLLKSASAGTGPQRTPIFPFLHSLADFAMIFAKEKSMAAQDLFRLYRGLLADVGLNQGPVKEAERQSGPYNLLMTRDWMLVIPRAKEKFESISINAIGFAGGLLVRDDHEMELLKQKGPMAALKHTGVPNPR